MSGLVPVNAGWYEPPDPLSEEEWDASEDARMAWAEAQADEYADMHGWRSRDV